MFTRLFRWFTFQTLLGAMRTGKSEFVESYWDLVYFYRYGLPGIRDWLPIPWPPEPQPDPSPEYWTVSRDILLLDILERFLDDPNPQPDMWFQVLGNSQLRIAAITKLISQLQGTISRLDTEIHRLEGLR